MKSSLMRHLEFLSSFAPSCQGWRKLGTNVAFFSSFLWLATWQPRQAKQADLGKATMARHADRFQLYASHVVTLNRDDAATVSYPNLMMQR